jgi:hypothetical protein
LLLLPVRSQLAVLIGEPPCSSMQDKDVSNRMLRGGACLQDRWWPLLQLTVLSRQPPCSDRTIDSVSNETLTMLQPVCGKVDRRYC